MKLINSSVEIVPQGYSVIEALKHIEKTARICYMSQDKITDASYEDMIKILKQRQHFSPFGHGTIYLTVEDKKVIDFYEHNPWSKVIYNGLIAFITTNMRVIIENNREDDLKYMTPPTLHELRVTVKTTCSIGISREWNRHAASLSICESSTRYCNFSKGKFGSEITYIIPQWIYDCQKELSETVDPLDYSSRKYLLDLDSSELLQEMGCMDRKVCAWLENLERVEKDYMYMITGDDGYILKPQDARGILPLDTATHVYYTGLVSAWEHFFDMRTAIAAHPDMRVLAENLEKQFIDKHLI